MLDRKKVLTSLPRVDKLLEDDLIKPFLEYLPRSYVVKKIRLILEETREQVLNDDFCHPSHDQIVMAVKKELEKDHRSLRRVINATGIVLHTNIGRAVLGKGAREAVQEVVKGFCNLELDLETGQRGTRYVHVEELICDLTGSESALVVNNNAAAVMLAVNTLAEDKEVIVSRGQLVEIGGSFRLPEVIAGSGAKLLEVGTTNKTYIGDYEKAVSEDTAALLKVHSSNFRMLGFVQETSAEELVKLGRQKGLPVIEDLGSGMLADLSKWNITEEPTVEKVLSSGVDIVTFSCDKLLGGPQAGIIAGRKKYVDKMKKNNLIRALRVDKMVIAALEATLWDYLYGEEIVEKNPTLKQLTMSSEEILKKAELIKSKFEKVFNEKVSLEIMEEHSQAGGGSLPGKKLPTFLLAVKAEHTTADKLAANLRKASTPVVTRIIEDRVAVDPRTVGDEEIDLLTASFQEAL